MRKQCPILVCLIVLLFVNEATTIWGQNTTSNGALLEKQTIPSSYYRQSTSRIKEIKSIVDMHCSKGEDLNDSKVVQTIMAEIEKQMPMNPAIPAEQLDSQTIKEKAKEMVRQEFGPFEKTIAEIEQEAEKRYPLYRINDFVTINYYKAGSLVSKRGMLTRITDKAIMLDDRFINFIDLSQEELSKIDHKTNQKLRSAYVKAQTQKNNQGKIDQEQIEQIYRSQIKKEMFNRNEYSGYIYLPKTSQWCSAKEVTEKYISQRLKKKTDSEKLPLDQLEELDQDASLPPPSNSAKEIHTIAEGTGISEKDALYDAFRNAIIKAVGMYVTSQSELKDKDFSERIIVNSDAIVANYQKIATSNQDGVCKVTIEANVLPNEYLKYAPKLKSEKVSSTEIGNLVAKRNALQDAEKTITTIFSDETLLSRMIRLKKESIEIAANVDLNSDKTKCLINFSASFDQKEFDKFQSRLRAVLERLALQKNTVSVTDMKDIPRDLGQKMWDKAGLPKSSDNYGFIAFAIHSNEKIRYTLYLLPEKIVRIIKSQAAISPTSHYGFDYGLQGTIVVSLILNDKETAKRIFFDTRLFDFCYREPGIGYGFPLNGNWEYYYPFTISNKMNVEIDYRYYMPFKQHLSISISNDDLDNLQQILMYFVQYDYSENKEKVDRISNAIEQDFF